jgi:hypothetical protein
MCNADTSTVLVTLHHSGITHDTKYNALHDTEATESASCHALYLIKPRSWIVSSHPVARVHSSLFQVSHYTVLSEHFISMIFMTLDTCFLGLHNATYVSGWLVKRACFLNTHTPRLTSADVYTLITLNSVPSPVNARYRSIVCCQ